MLSETVLAELLDGLAIEGSTFIHETPDHVSSAGLTMAHARLVLDRARSSGWRASIFDSENTLFSAETLDDACSPYRVVIEKPAGPEGVLRILTNTAFGQWLDQNDGHDRWQVARLAEPIRTRTIHFTDWTEIPAPPPSFQAKSPRSLVREYREPRVTPRDIRRWLMVNTPYARDDAAYRLWALRSARVLAWTVCNEIESEDQSLKFRGPPRLTLTAIDPQIDPVDVLGSSGFLALQAAVDWIFELERDAEVRHTLFATEIAQCGGTETDAFICLGKHAAAALEGARIAYQMSLSDVTRDTIKVLGDLRKAVNEEVGKLTEQTRQFVNAGVAALAAGLGLIAVRLATPAQPWLIVSVMALVAAHVGISAGSGLQFIALQKSLRKDWRPRLYRFLPQIEYDRIAEAPIAGAERAFRRWAVAGLVAMIFLLGIVVWASLFDGGGVATTGATPRSPAPPAAEHRSLQEWPSAPKLNAPQNDKVPKVLAPATP